MKTLKYKYQWTPGGASQPHRVMSRNGTYVASCGSERMARKITALLNDEAAYKKRKDIDDAMAADLRSITGAL